MSLHSVSEVVDYIFSSSESGTLIGQKMKQAAVVKVQPIVRKAQEEEDKYRLIIHDIRNYDKNDNVCWIDYRSWVSLPLRLQNSITDLLEPRAWRGIIFRYDQWATHEKSIVVNMHEEIVLILAKYRLNRYRIYSIPLYKSYLDWMSPSKFKELTQQITTNAIKTYGRANGTIYILDNQDHLESIPVL